MHRNIAKTLLGLSLAAPVVAFAHSGHGAGESHFALHIAEYALYAIGAAALGYFAVKTIR